MGLLKNIFTLGGAYRMEAAQKRYAECSSRYERLILSLNSTNEEIESTVTGLRKSFIRTRRDLLLANKMLSPTCVEKSKQEDFGQITGEDHSLSIRQRAGLMMHNSNTTDLSIGGVAVGATTAILAWQGAQVLGFASTGTAMLGLHGAAASNAGWALFGGGSLATGGGGMWLGHMVLPGIGLAVAVGFGAITTHSKANEINSVCESIDKANEENTATLAKVDSNLNRLRKAERVYSEADISLKEAVVYARRKLRRFGPLTVFFRFLRFKMSGVYYTLEEEKWVIELGESVAAFMRSVGQAVE